MTDPSDFVNMIKTPESYEWQQMPPNPEPESTARKILVKAGELCLILIGCSAPSMYNIYPGPLSVSRNTHR